MSTKDHVAVRLDSESLARVDALRTLLDTEWRSATRSDVLRLLILKGLEDFEKKHHADLGKRRAPAAEPGATTPKRARRGKAAKAIPAGAKAAPALPPKRARKKSAPPST